MYWQIYKRLIYGWDCGSGFREVGAYHQDIFLCLFHLVILSFSWTTPLNFFTFLTDADPFDFLQLALWQLETFSGPGLFRNMRTKGFNQSCRFLGPLFILFLFFLSMKELMQLVASFWNSFFLTQECQRIYGPFVY